MNKKKVSEMLLALATELEKEETDKTSKEQPKQRQYSTSSVTKSKIIAHIKSHGGATVRDIMEGTDLANQTIYGHMKTLVDEAEVVKVGVRYYMPNSAPKEEVEVKKVYPEAGTPTEATVQHVEDILEFVSKNMGKRYSMGQLARACNVPSGSISRLVYNLVKKGTLPKNFNLGDTPLEEEKKVPATPVNSGKQTLYEIFDKSVWEFVRETRSTDVLQFLTWLEKK